MIADPPRSGLMACRCLSPVPGADGKVWVNRHYTYAGSFVAKQRGDGPAQSELVNTPGS
jgi:hypothetical protein